jgi:Tfp pilus assembly protein PilX
LVTALVLMLVVLMLGVAAARAAALAEKSARHERDRQVALAMAEAALLDGERDIEGAAATAPGRASLFDGPVAGLPPGCGRGQDDLGVCASAGPASPPQWQLTDLVDDEATTVGFGTFTGARMATGEGALPARMPRYIIEAIAMPAGLPGAGRLYRITAVGFGTRPATRVVLQSFYRKPTPAGPPDTPPPATSPPPQHGAGGPAAVGSAAPATGTNGQGGTGPGETGPPGTQPPAASLPAGRVAWREIANWPELHRAAVE